MRRVASCAALLLAACQPGATTASDGQLASAAPAQAFQPSRPSDFNRDIDARGTEPFWALTIRGDRLVLKRPEAPDVLAHWPNPRIEGERAEWLGVTREGAPMKVVLVLETCSDGMSDTVYPMRAEVAFAQETWNGCAIPVSP